MCTLNNQKTSRDASFKLWISIERCIEIITGQPRGWLNYLRYQPSQMIPSLKNEGSSVRMTAMCSVKINTVWFGDSRGFIHSINESDNTCVNHFSYELDSVPIIGMYVSRKIEKKIILLFFFVCRNRMHRRHKLRCSRFRKWKDFHPRFNVLSN